MAAEDKNITRRNFLKIAAMGAISSQFLPGCSNSNAASVPAKTITILGFVDVAQALADSSLDNNLYWLDNNSGAGSLYQGTDHLKTAVKNGDSVQWIISGLEVETRADIVKLAGKVEEIANIVSVPIAPGVNFWIGQIITTATGLFQYNVTLKVESRLMISSKLSLDVYG